MDEFAVVMWRFWYRVKSRWGGRAGLAPNFYFRYRSTVHEIHRHSNLELTNLNAKNFVKVLAETDEASQIYLQALFLLLSSTFYYSMKYLCIISPRLFS